MAIPRPKPQPEQQADAYSPPGPQPLVFEQFDGVNTSTSRPGVEDSKMWWCDGFMPIGPRYLRTLPGVGVPLWTVTQSIEPLGTTIALFKFYNIGGTFFAIVFLSNGSIYTVNTATRAQRQIAPAGTILNPSQGGVGTAQYGAQFVIIVALQANGYFIWDGAVFYKPGDVGPDGGTMPLGLFGNAVEIYTGRVWIAALSTILFSAPGSVTDFTTASGGGEFTSSDSFLRVVFVALRQSNGFLYLIADSSVNYISGVQTSAGSPPVTTFTNQNADPEVGSPWPDTVVTFGRNIMFANSWGVHVSYGAAVTKISEPLDGVYNTVPGISFAASAAKQIIFGKKVFMLLYPIVDPRTAVTQLKFLMWNGKQWFASLQDANLIYIADQEIVSQLFAYGTDSVTIWPLFTLPSASFTKAVMSRLWDAPQGYQFIKTVTNIWGLMQFFTRTQNAVNISIDNELGGVLQPLSFTNPNTDVVWTNQGGAIVPWVNASSQVVPWGATNITPISVINPTAVGQQGVLTGLTFTTICPDMALVSLMHQPEIAAYRA